MKVLSSTWAFKIKRYPKGCFKKFKAQFCACGDRQTEGVDYFKTWAPVVHWSTVQIVMILAIKLNLISIQCDITACLHSWLCAPHKKQFMSTNQEDSIVVMMMKFSGWNKLYMAWNSLHDIFFVIWQSPWWSKVSLHQILILAYLWAKHSSW